MVERLHVREYAPIPDVSARLHDLREGVAQLKSQLQPTLRQLHFDGRGVSLGNVVGSFALPSGDVVEVAPKVGSGDWTTAVVHLLADDTRLAVTGSRHSRPSNRKDDLTAALALEYARRLERALRKDGPMLVYERHHEVSRKWRGQLDVTAWVRKSAIDPTRFPMGRDELSTLNDFTRGLSIVAGILGKSAAGSEAASHLRRLQNMVIPGAPVPAFVNSASARRRLPAQWKSYTPAWDIAAAILRNRSVVGSPGRAVGVEVAVEPWRLLETFVERALAVLASRNEHLHVAPKVKHGLLIAPADAGTDGGKALPRSVEPDGLLKNADGDVVASFEAKYTGEPDRGHVYQTLATAAALNSPLAVLVYPWPEPPRRFDVQGFHGHPGALVSIGIDLFSYRRGDSDRELASTIQSLLAEQGTAAARSS
ncbi:5-methylcytosine restriction system specificity protein McrC [Prescottella equi]|uniref:5-methylcytosine restriction system specificity protein McrC n=1 Tax=Rhodococcus hoagii TaxID=43767 RepID=UPI000A0F44D2|nr:hypothetical protein [Prescottella equi]